MPVKTLQGALTGLLWNISATRRYRGAPWVPPNSLRDLWIYPEHGLVFNQLRKAGASSTLVFLAERLSGPVDPLVAPETEPERAYRLAKKLAQARAVQVSPSLLLKESSLLANSLWFTVVRQPQIRLLSAFLSTRKYRAHSVGKHGWNARMALKPSPPGITAEDEVEGFRLFLDYLEEGGLHANPHWAPQASLLVLPVRSFDYVVKLEDFDSGIRQVLSHIPWGKDSLRNRHVSWGGANMRWERTGATQRQREFFPKEARLQSERLCANDLNLFHYEPLHG